jgi:putative nucleotidyltransferase with HDIG domain
MRLDHDKLAKMVERIPPFPQSVNRILEITSSMDCPPKEIVAVIEHDPILTMKLLKLVNSAYFGLSNEVTSIKQTVVYVGINTIKNVAISLATLAALPKTTCAGLDAQQIWRHSLQVGVIARLVARHKKIPSGQLASYFVAGLLHDIGKLVLAEFLADEYATLLTTEDAAELILPLYVREQQRFGVDHAEVGGLIAEKWQFPAELVASIRLHHHTKLPMENPLALSIAFANVLCHYLEQRELDAKVPLPELSGVLKTWAGDVEGALKNLTDLDEELQKAQAFLAASS